MLGNTMAVFIEDGLPLRRTTSHQRMAIYLDLLSVYGTTAAASTEVRVYLCGHTEPYNEKGKERKK
jgi:hypothetical protein